MAGHIMIRGAKIPVEETASRNQLKVIDDIPGDINLYDSILFGLVLDVGGEDISLNLSDSILFGDVLDVGGEDFSTIITEAVTFINT